MQAWTNIVEHMVVWFKDVFLLVQKDVFVTVAFTRTNESLLVQVPVLHQFFKLCGEPRMSRSL